MIKMNVGSKIKEMRLNFGMTQAELAKVLGVSRPTISSWEVDRTEPAMEDIQTMALYFGCSVNDLIGKKYQEDVIRDYNMQRLMAAVEGMSRDQLTRLIQYAQYIKWEDKEGNKNGDV